MRTFPSLAAALEALSNSPMIHEIKEALEEVLSLSNRGITCPAERAAFKAAKKRLEAVGRAFAAELGCRFRK